MNKLCIFNNGDIVKELRKREQKWAVALMSDQCELLNDSAKSELRTMLGFSESERSSNASDDDESSDQDNLSSINDSKNSGRNSDDGADDSDVTEQCQEEDSGSVFTAVEAYDIYCIKHQNLGINFEMACHRTDYEFIREYVLLSTYRHCTAFRHDHA